MQIPEGNTNARASPLPALTSKPGAYFGDAARHWRVQRIEGSASQGGGPDLGIHGKRRGFRIRAQQLDVKEHIACSDDAPGSDRGRCHVRLRQLRERGQFGAKVCCKTSCVGTDLREGHVKRHLQANISACTPGRQQ